MWRRLQSRSSNAHAVQRRAEYGRILQRSGRKYDFDAAKPLAAGQEISWSSNVRRVLSSEVLDEPQNSRTRGLRTNDPWIVELLILESGNSKPRNLRNG